MHIYIISTNHPNQQMYWAKKLKGRGHVISIYEDWEGGAGNGLGTLYAFKEAARQSGLNLIHHLEEGTSISLYHTAGYGKRLAPLVSCEHNNKSAIELPGSLTVLEAVIKQTSSFAPVREGRLSVYWSDQIFLPTEPIRPTENHIDLFSRSIKWPDQELWTSKGLSSYGLIGNNQLYNKLTYDQFQTLNKENNLRLSLGCFSLSRELLQALLDEFSTELKAKKGYMDSDPHFWMPATLDKALYLKLLGSEKHYDRMHAFYQQFSDPLFGSTDIGTDAFWWDFGSLPHYFNNLLKLTQIGRESEAMRKFFKVDSCISNSKIESGEIKNSVLIGVEAKELHVENCVIINSKLNSLRARNCLLYKVNEDTPIKLEDHSVRADTLLQNEETIPMQSSLKRNGKSDWSKQLENNRFSYEELCQVVSSRT